MENNQEHKIDKIFKDALDNQSVVPPLDAWTAVQTYTIGQEESKKKVWVKYASLALLALLFSGLGLWHFVDNERRTSLLLTQKVVSEDTDHNKGGKVKLSEKTKSTVIVTLSQEMVSGDTDDNNKKTVLHNAGSVKISNQFARVSKKILNKKMNERMRDFNSHEALIKIPTTENKPLIISDSISNQNIELIEPISYLTNDKVKIINSKSLILNDLSLVIQKENENKIVALKENIIGTKEVFKVDSIDYGSKFSLRHPIISYGFGMMWNFWNVERQTPINGLIDLPNRNLRGATVKIGIAWKVNKRLRMGLSVGTNGLNAGIPFISIPLPPTSSAFGTLPIINLTKINSDDFYQAETPFGNVNLPVSLFKDVPTFKPSVLDEQKRLFYSDSHLMTTSQFSINSQYDLFSKNRKKGKQHGYQLYGLLDCNIQRQVSYSYTATTLYLIWVERQWEQKILKISQDNNRLENASEFVFGLRTGLGFRYQFARKWDFFVEGSGQHSLNNWVKSSDIKTFQRTLSLQAGINLNL